MKKQILAIVFGLVVGSVMLLSVSHVSAATSKLLYISYDGLSTIDVNTINSDGTGDTNLTNGGADQSNGQFGVEWSPDGTKIAFVRSNGAGSQFNLYVMNADGSNLTALTSDDVSGGFGIYWSPDSSKLVYTKVNAGPTYNIYSINADGTSDTQLTNSGTDACAQWTVNNKIAFVSFRDSDAEVYTMDADGSNQTNITNNPASEGVIDAHCNIDVSHDGDQILFSSDRDDPGSGTELYKANIDGSSQTRLTTNSNPTGATTGFPNWSHDDSKIAYGSDQHDPGNGPNGIQIYVMDSDGSNNAQLTTAGGNVLVTNVLFGGIRWSPDDSQIAFSSNRNGSPQVFLMNADGASQTVLVAGYSFIPRWQPLVQTDGGGNNSNGSSSVSSSSSGTLAQTGLDIRLIGLAATALLITGLGILFWNQRLIGLVRRR